MQQTALGQYRLDKIATLPGHTDRIWYCAWSPGGTALATCGSDKTIRVWKKASKIGPHEDIGDNTTQLAGSIYPQGVRDNLLADVINNALVEIPYAPGQTPTEEGGAILVNKNDWELMQVLENCHTRSIRSLAWSPSGRHIAAASFDHSVSIWELIDGEFELTATLRGHENEVKSVDWNSTGELLVTSSRDKTIWLWENDGADGWECSSVLTGHNGDVKKVAFHPFSDDVISTSYDDTVRIWQALDDDWYNAITLSDSTSTVWDYALTSNARFMTTVGDDNHLRVYTYDDTKPLPKQWRIVVENKIAKRPIFAVTNSKQFFIPQRLSAGALPNDELSANQYTVYKTADGGVEEYFVGLSPNNGVLATADGDNNVNIFEMIRKIPQDQLNNTEFFDITKAIEISTKDIIPLKQKSALLNKAPRAGDDNEDDEQDNNNTASALPTQPELGRDVTDPLYTSHIDGMLNVVHVKNAHGNDINKICWNPKISNLLATVGDDNQVNLWRLTRD